MSYDIITMFQYILFIIYLIWVCMMNNKTYTFSISLVRYNADMFLNTTISPPCHSSISFISVVRLIALLSKYTFKFLTLLKSIFLSTASISYNSLLFLYPHLLIPSNHILHLLKQKLLHQYKPHIHHLDNLCCNICFYIWISFYVIICII